MTTTRSSGRTCLLGSRSAAGSAGETQRHGPLVRSFLLGSFVVAGSLGGLSSARADDDVRFWQEGDALLLRRDSWQAGMGWKLSFAEEPHDLNAWELKPKVQARLRPWLDIAATYKFARGRNASGDWSNTHVLELDLAPSWRMSDRLSVQFAQRLAIAHPPNGPKELLYRYHTIPSIKWPAAWLATQTSVESSLEAIYDFRSSCWVETKFTPLKIRFSAGRSASWSLFYVLNDKRANAAGPWQRSHVVVLGLTFDLTGKD